MHVHLESVYFPKMSSVYKHIAITSTSVKSLAPGVKLNIPWTPAWEMNSYLNAWHGLVDMKALIERVALKEGAKAEWHQARVDVAGGYDVTWVCASPTRQCSSSSEDWPLVQVNAGTHGGCTHRHIKREVGDVKRRGAHFTLWHGCEQCHYLSRNLGFFLVWVISWQWK